MGKLRDLRQCLVPDDGCGRLGAVPLRSLGLGRSLGLDLGRRCAMGIRTLSLRPLGMAVRTLGLVSRRLCPAAGMGACARRLVWRSGMGILDKPWGCRVRMATARLGRSVPAALALFRELPPSI